MPLDLSAELALALQDWGRTIVHQRVAQTYDPATQSTTETVVATDLQAIVGPEEAALADGTAGQHLMSTRTCLVRQDDWPSSASIDARRIVIDTAVYEITQETELAGAGLRELRLRRLR